MFFVDTDARNCNQGGPCVTHAYADNGRWTKKTLGVCAYLHFPLATLLTPFLYAEEMGENESVVSSRPESHLLITP